MHVHRDHHSPRPLTALCAIKLVHEKSSNVRSAGNSSVMRSDHQSIDAHLILWLLWVCAVVYSCQHCKTIDRSVHSMVDASLGQHLRSYFDTLTSL